MRDSYLPLRTAERDFVFLLPAPVTPRKNLDFAIQVVTKLRDAGRNPLLMITGPPARNSPSAERYGGFLRQSMPEEMWRHVVLINDFFPVTDEILRDLYLLADCLLFPSPQEGFGLPIIEAAYFRLPIWCQDVPAYREIADTGAAFLLPDLARLDEAVAWLEGQPTFRQQRQCRGRFEPSSIYHEHYEPLLASLFALSAQPAPV